MAVNARALLIKSKTLGADPLVDKILATEDSAEKSLYLKALELKQSSLKAMYVEACLLASQDFVKIGELLEIDPAVVEMYANIYYNTVGIDKLSKLELLNVKDRQESLMKIWALSQGLEFISWRLGNKVIINPVEGLRDLFTTCVYKAKEAMFSGNDSESSKEATKWTKLSLDFARLLKVWTMDSEEARKDIELALAEVIPEFKGFQDLE